MGFTVGLWLMEQRLVDAVFQTIAVKILQTLVAVKWLLPI